MEDPYITSNGEREVVYEEPTRLKRGSWRSLVSDGRVRKFCNDFNERGRQIRQHFDSALGEDAGDLCRYEGTRYQHPLRRKGNALGLARILRANESVLRASVR